MNFEILILSPYPDKAIKSVEIEEFNFELQYYDEKLKTLRILPYSGDKTSIHLGEVPEGVKITWQSAYKAKVDIKNKRFVIAYKEATVGGKPVTDYEIEFPPSKFPKFIESLNIQEDGFVDLQVNNFTSNPYREGDIPYYRFTYKDGPVAYARADDQHRPILFNLEIPENEK